MRLPVLLALLSFLALVPCSAQTNKTAPFPPHKIADNLYYVGNRDLSSYLITSEPTGKQGMILINPSFEETVPIIRASIEKLGFRFNDVKILLISHAHDDHAAGCARVMELTGAKLMVMDADVPEIEGGGKGDFQYPSRWKPAKVDRVLHDGDTVSIGSVRLVAHLTPGHTKGCTTWTMQTTLQGKPENVVIVGSPNVNEGYKLVNNREYPGIVSDFQKTFRVLKSLPCDIFLGAHGAYYDLPAKYKKLEAGNQAAFVDPEGYRTWVNEKENAFLANLKKQGGQVGQ